MLKLLSVLVLILTFGVGNVWGVPTKCTSTSDLKAGDVYYISSASTYSASAVVMAKSTGGNNFPQSTFNVSPVELTLGGNSTNGWTFSYKDGSNTYYLDPTNTTSSNYLKRSESITNYGKFTITFNSGKAVITSKGKSSRNVVRYNSGSSCFSCYTSGQGDVYLYKKESGYSITYHCNGATSGCPSNASGQTKLPATLPTPSKTGCTFAGWYTNEGLTTAAVAGATLSADANLYAKWTTNVTLNRNGVTETINDVVVGTDLDEIDGSGDQGGCSAWTFIGWSKTQRAAQNVSTEMTLVTEIDGPGPYYAVYSHTESGGENTASSNNLSSTSTSTQTVETGKPITYKCSSSNTYSNPARIYKNGTFTIAGGTITHISLTGVADYAISNMTVNTGSLSTSGNNGTWTGSAASVVFTASKGQARVSAISVTYTGGSTTYYSTTATCCSPLGSINGSFFWTTHF